LKEEPFIMYLGDNLLKEGVVEFVEKFKNDTPNALILLTRVGNPQAFGVAELDKEGRVKRLVEKPKQPKSNLALVGVYFFDRNIFKAVNDIKPSWRGELEITDAIQYLLDHNYTVESYKVSGWWKDTGKPEDVLSANRLVLGTIERDIQGEIVNSSVDGRVKVGEGTKIINSLIRGPAIIGENTLIINSYIGPFTSVNGEARIENSEIENSIVMKKSFIKDLEKRIDESLIGRETRISRAVGKPGVHKFILGERSQIEVL
jgi:glucose-1-phosphate thymidylyltransferase